MAREIITSQDILKITRAENTDAETSATSRINSRDGYFDRLFKYIPAELVAGYIFVLGTVKQLTDVEVARLVNWLIFAVFAILTPLYLNRVQKVAKTGQLIISTISFAVWVFALGGPFTLTEWYNPVYGSLLLPVFTLLVAIWEAD
ncbi:MAG: hypothetical protein GX431_01765 [Bacteroidales bacterium]|jgi:hypothetical protein|nr:hypothetical protein [Bacteroidales bacterium]